MSSDGWKVAPGGRSKCIKPGTGAGTCGPRIKSGQTIAFTVDSQSGAVAVQNEMNDMAAQAKKIGITINLTTHPFQTVVAAAVPCKPTEPTCKWEAENWGAGWIHGPAYLPPGEPLYNPGSAANAGSYSRSEDDPADHGHDHRSSRTRITGPDQLRQLRLDPGPRSCSDRPRSEPTAGSRRPWSISTWAGIRPTRWAS